MDLSVLLPPELLTVALPESRAVPPFQRRQGTETEAPSALLPFAFLLQQASATPLPAGGALPVTGKTLPAAAASPGLPLDAQPPVAGRLDWGAGAAPPAAHTPLPPGGAERAGANAGGLPTEPFAVLDAADAASFAELPSAAGSADDTPHAGGAAPQLADAAFDVDLPETAPSAASAPPGAEPVKPQAAAQTIAALVGAPAPSGGEPRLPHESVLPAAPAARNADRPTRASEPLELELGAATAADDAAQPLAVTDDAPLAPKPAERAARAPLPSFGLSDAVAGTSSPAAHGLTTSPSQAAAGTPTAASTQAEPPTHPHGGVDTTAARWNETLANRIHWLVDHDIGEARIKLNPAELGALDVTISMQDDKTYVQLTAHSASARDELTHSLPRLRELLTAHGLELGGATVSGGRDDRPSPGPSAAPVVRALDGLAAASLDDLPRAPRGARSQIDVFA